MAGCFQYNEQGFVIVYVDGACLNNGQWGSQGGIGVFFGDGHYLNVSRRLSDGRPATNNRAEIEAVTVAARQATGAGIYKLEIRTDSKFVINCYTEWMPKWERNGWRNTDGREVVNKEELIEMKCALKPLHIQWTYVRGHSKTYGNEMADKLAKAAAAGHRYN